MLSKRILTLMFVVAFLTLLIGCIPSPTLPNQAPIITSSPVTTATVGEAYTYDVEATDPDEDTLTYSLDVRPEGMTIHSLFGLIDWTPTVEGEFNVVVKVSDGDLDITQNFTITVSKPWTPGPGPGPGPAPPVNHAPIITSTPITDAIVGVAYIYDVDATDPDGDTLTYSLTTPSGMTIDPATGVINWTPTSGQLGDHAVTVKASDGDKSDTQSFTVVVVENQPPTADVGPNRIVVMNTLFRVITFTGTGTDPDGTVISYSWDFGDGNTDTGATVNHTYSQYGTYPVTLTVTDNGGVIGSENMSLEIYDTIQKGIDAGNSVDLIEVMAGIYHESVDVNKSLTLQGEDRDTTQIVFGWGLYPTASPLTISADGVTVSGFTIHSGLYIEPAWTIVVEGDSALLTDLHVIKDPCFWPNSSPRIGGSAILIGTPVGGSGVGGVDSFTFTDSIVNSAWNGIYAPRNPGSSNIVVRNVDFTYPGEYAILLMIVTGATIEDNTFTCTADKYGVTVTRGSNNIEIVDNEFIGSGSLAASHIGILLQAYCAGTMGDVDILNNGISEFNTGILVEDVDTSGIFIHYNNIFSNVTGVNNAATAGLDAIDNWWGDLSGPYHPITNPLGIGDTVTDNVGYIPWSTSSY